MDEGRCLNCGKPVAPMVSTIDPRGVTMQVIDKDRHFHSLRCAARFGIRMAQLGGRLDVR